MELKTNEKKKLVPEVLLIDKKRESELDRIALEGFLSNNTHTKAMRFIVGECKNINEVVYAMWAYGSHRTAMAKAKMAAGMFENITSKNESPMRKLINVVFGK